MTRSILPFLISSAFCVVCSFAFIPQTTTKQRHSPNHHEHDGTRCSPAVACCTPTGFSLALHMSSWNKTNIINSILHEEPSGESLPKSNKGKITAPTNLFGFWNGVAFGGVAADLVALLIAFELQGLLDALNASDFVARGGWFQPLPAVQDSTLQVLVQRLSLNSILWIVSLLSLVVSRKSDENQSSPTQSENPEIQDLPASMAVFAVLRCLLAPTITPTGVALVVDSPNLPFPLLYDAVRDIYFVGLAMFFIRLLRPMLPV